MNPHEPGIEGRKRPVNHTVARFSIQPCGRHVGRCRDILFLIHLLAQREGWAVFFPETWPPSLGGGPFPEDVPPDDGEESAA